MKIIAKLAIRQIASKKIRSIVTCTAILLTIILFMTIVSISTNILTGFSLAMQLASGTDYHGYLRAPSFTVDERELQEAAAQDKNVRESAIFSNLTTYAFTEEELHRATNTLKAVESEDNLSHFFTKVTEGTFPKTDGEILVHPLYFPDVKIGDTVTLYYVQTFSTHAQTASADFTVSGWMESSADSPMQAVLRYSDTLEETYRFGGRYMVYVHFENGINLTGKYDTLVNETLGAYRQPDLERYGGLNPTYLSSAADQWNLANVFLIVFAVSVVFLCSFLLIYNVYSIALTQDMQSYGLLSVIGMTRRQIRKMIVIQSLLLFAMTLPVGLAAGYWIGWKMLSPILFSEVFSTDVPFRFTPWIPVLTSALALFTLLWSAVRPLKKLRSLTPIATVDYHPAADLPKRYVRKKNYTKKNITPNTGRMAVYTISRNRKKTVITALSMSISVILFMLIATLCDYMLAYTNSVMQKSDYIVKPAYEYQYVGQDSGGSRQYAMDSGVGFSKEFIAALERSPYCGRIRQIRTALVTMDTPAETRAMLRELKPIDRFWNAMQQQILEGKMEVLIIGIPDEWYGDLMDENRKKIGKGYEEGWVMTGYTSSRFISEERTVPYSYFTKGETVRLGEKDYTIGHVDEHLAAINICRYNSISWDRPVLYMTEHAFLETFGEGMTSVLLADAAENCYDLLRTELEAWGQSLILTVDEDVFSRHQAMQEQQGYSEEEILASYISIDGKLDAFKEMQKRVTSIQIVGYSLAGMIFLIGILNIVNTSFSSAAERKQEFAILGAVGMTNRQLGKMLLIESLCGGGVAVLITVCVGFPLIALIINTAMDALVSLNWVSGIIMLAVCVAVSVSSGLATFRMTKSASEDYSL